MMSTYHQFVIMQSLPVCYVNCKLILHTLNFSCSGKRLRSTYSSCHHI